MGAVRAPSNAALAAGDFNAAAAAYQSGLELEPENHELTAAIEMVEVKRGDAAVREEQNRAPTTPQQLKEMIENKIKLASATWQLKKMTQEHGKDFNTIKQHDAKMGAELNAYFKTRFEQLNHGER